MTTLDRFQISSRECFFFVEFIVCESITILLIITMYTESVLQHQLTNLEESSVEYVLCYDIQTKESSQLLIFVIILLLERKMKEEMNVTA